MQAATDLSENAPGARPGPSVRPPARRARFRARHKALLVSFFLMVLLPAGISAWYLWGVAADQYASTVAFSVRKEETSSAVELLGGITELSGSSSSDTDILYEFLQSQKLISDIDAQIDLRGLWSKPKDDPWFRFDPAGSIEDLMDHWARMVRISYDSGTGIIEVQVLAFDPGDAQVIAGALFARSSEMINDLSAIAREDAIRYAREELQEAEQRLTGARRAVTGFRNRNQLVDPEMDLQAQAGLLGTLQAQLASALIEIDLLQQTTKPGDPRILQAERRVQVIEERIAAERRKLGLGGTGAAGLAMADVVGEFESLVVEREFAERTYTSALATFDAAKAEARRKSRYLAAHIDPTRAETARYPQRWTLLGLLSLFLSLCWAITVLVIYALKDRR